MRLLASTTAVTNLMAPGAHLDTGPTTDFALHGKLAAHGGDGGGGHTGMVYRTNSCGRNACIHQNSNVHVVRNEREIRMYTLPSVRQTRRQWMLDRKTCEPSRLGWRGFDQTSTGAVCGAMSSICVLEASRASVCWTISSICVMGHLKHPCCGAVSSIRVMGHLKHPCYGPSQASLCSAISSIRVLAPSQPTPSQHTPTPSQPKST